MKRIVFASLLFATPAMAQQAQYTPTTQVLLNQALSCEMAASAQIGQLNGQIETLKKQLADITKERDALKMAQSPAADVATPARK